MEFSQWAAPTVYVKKKSKEIHVCTDFSTGLNAVLIDYHYTLPSPEEVFTKLNGGKIFSKVDLSDVYLQIPVEVALYKHPQGFIQILKVTVRDQGHAGHSQKVMDTMLDGLDFAIAYHTPKMDSSNLNIFFEFN